MGKLKLLDRKWLAKKKDKGRFYCPECRTIKKYLLQEFSKYLFLLFLPVYKTDTCGDHILCSSCKNTFWVSVLECSPEITKQNFNPSVLRLMVLMMLADGKIENEEYDSIKHIYLEVTDERVKDKDIQSYIENVEKENVSVDEYLKRITPYLNDYKKTLIIKAAYLISVADGIIHEKEERLLKEIKQALNLDNVFFNRVVQSLQISGTDDVDVAIEQAAI